MNYKALGVVAILIALVAAVVIEPDKDPAVAEAERKMEAATKASRDMDKRIQDKAFQRYQADKARTERADQALERARVRVGNDLADAEGH